MKKFFIKTLGCKTNQVESAILSEILINNGFFETDNLLEADFFILNSCSVTHIADSKNLYFLRHAKKENPNVLTVLTGCMAQLEKQKLIEQNIADFIIGNYEKNDIAEIINSNKKYNVSDIFAHNDFRYEKLKKIPKTRASVKIQDGCNNRCSYCTIPFARGKSRSDTIEHIIEQINLFANFGYYETVLTGIHIGQWGLDFKEKKSFLNLLEAIENTNIHRYRLGSLNPIELSYDVINFLAQSKKFCPHFHLSLQSCCNDTLKAMNRHYSVDKIKEIVNSINENFAFPFIGSDIIVGFPGETIENFETTLNNLNELKITKMHIFPYSRRKGTIADKLPNQISDKDKKQRYYILKNISDKKLNNFFNSNINIQNEIIIEKKRDKKTNYLKGVTRNYIDVLIDSDKNLEDTLQNIVLLDIIENEERMIAKIV